MRIALAQINATLGDFSENRIKILEFTRRALEQRCDLVVFPEHALVGYLPNDLIERHSIVEDQLRELKKLEKELPSGISVLVGCVTFAVDRKERFRDSMANKVIHNSAALIVKGKPTKFFHKERLPTYDIFDEARHLLPGSLKNSAVKLRVKSGSYTTRVTICEDIWGWGGPENPMKNLPRSGTDFVINLSASPFTKQKKKKRLDVLKATAAHFRAPVVFVNLVGAQDEVLFDGRSVVMDSKGKVIAELSAFEEELAVFDFSTNRVERERSARLADVELLRRALVTGIRDFALKTGLGRVHFGLSGGIDSALVACLAVEALGNKAITAVTLPGPFNAGESRELAERLAKTLSIRCLNKSIAEPYEAMLASYEAGGAKLEFGLVHENLQARIRGMLLMMMSNNEQSLLLSTANKAELAVGYSTLYGDLCGGLAPLGDLLKHEIYALARHYNAEREIIPVEIIERPPSAELRPGQKDQDSLPPYDELDAAVERIIEHRLPARTAVEKFVLNASFKSEFKRWQAPPVLKVSDHSFGRGRRMPIAHRARS